MSEPTSKVITTIAHQCRVSVEDLKKLQPLLATIHATHNAFFKACVAICNWVSGNIDRQAAIVAILVQCEKMSVDAAERTVKQYLKFGNGELDPRFFALPSGVRDMIAGFSTVHINNLLKQPLVDVVIFDQASREHVVVKLAYDTLPAKVMEQVFTPLGNQRTPEEQLCKLQLVPVKDVKKTANAQVHFQKGYVSFAKLTEAQVEIGRTIEDVNRLERLISMQQKAVEKLLAMRDALLAKNLGQPVSKGRRKKKA
jgi:hypothetical protein